MFGKFTKAYLLITLLIAFLAAFYVAHGIFFPVKPSNPVKENRVIR